MKLNYAIIFVSDMGRSVAFYRDLLGASLKFETPEWTEFDTGDATLALHRSEPSRGSAGKDLSTAGQCRPGFTVGDLDSFHSKMVASNVETVESPRDVFGARIAQYRDPDGLIISVSEARR
jgi:catechol 2,3-dioxygenase-like lactoylglutathione lyase family enzyme